MRPSTVVSAVSCVLTAGVAALAAYLPPSELAVVAILAMVVVVTSWTVGFVDMTQAVGAGAGRFFLSAVAAGLVCSLIFGVVFMVVIVYVVPNYTGDDRLGGIAWLFRFGAFITAGTAAAGASILWASGRLTGRRRR